MRASLWLRILAIVLFLFAAGHTLGTAAPRVHRGPSEAAVFAAMQSYRFPVMGFTRSYWDFHRGFALIISVLLLFMALVAWQLGAMAREHPRQALPMAVSLLLGCVGLLVISSLFFFTVPIVTSAISIVCSTTAVVLLARQ